MDKRIKTYSIGEVAKASGVSVRMLRHYDEIGLLAAFVRDNGYRAYGQEDLERLQEILAWRAIKFGLAEIAELMDGGDRLDRLQRQKAMLADKLDGLRGVLETLDDAIEHAKEGHQMSIEDLYKPFSAEKQAEYEAWLIETYGEAMAEAIAASKVAVQKIPEGMEGQMERLKELEGALVDAFQAGADAADALCDEHRAWVASMWGRECSKLAYAGLADMYLSHPDFVVRYEALAPKFSEWLPRVMKGYAGRDVSSRT